MNLRLDDEPRSIFSGRVRATTIGILILVSLIAFEAMAVSTALPTAARELNGVGAYGWAFTGFLVANIIGMVMSGQLSDRRGAALPLACGLVAFVAGLALAGAAVTMPMLIAGRVVQGIGSGLMITAIYVIVGQAYTDELRPSLFAAFSSAWVVPGLVGPLLSGTITQHLTWRLVFLAIVPFGVLGGVLLLPVLRTLARPEATTGPGALRRLLLAVAVAGGIALLEAAGQHPSAVLGVVALAGLVAMVWGLRGLLPPGTMSARPGVPAPVALRGLLAGAFFGLEAILPLALSVQHDFSATAAGLPLTITGLTWAVGSWWQSRARDEAGNRRRIALVRAGFCFVTAAAIGFTVTVLPDTPGWVVYPVWLTGGFGAGLAMASLGVVLLRHTSDATRGQDSAALQLSDATTSALTTGVGGVLVAAAARGTIGYTAAFVTIGAVMAVLAVLGVVAAGRLRPPDAAATVTQEEVAAAPV
ncbi:MFS transporter [Jatrophihabitans fulvus]